MQENEEKQQHALRLAAKREAALKEKEDARADRAAADVARVKGLPNKRKHKSVFAASAHKKTVAGGATPEEVAVEEASGQEAAAEEAFVEEVAGETPATAEAAVEPKGVSPGATEEEPAREEAAAPESTVAEKLKDKTVEMDTP